MNLMDSFADTIRQEAFQAFVGRTMFCPICEAILDVSRATGVTVTADDVMVLYRIYCSKCVEASQEQAVSFLRTVSARMPHGTKLNIELETETGVITESTTVTEQEEI